MQRSWWHHVQLAVIATVGLVWAYGMFSLATLPVVSVLRTTFPQRTAYMELSPDPSRIDYHPVPLARISPLLRRAVVLAEDDQFHEHPGYRWEAIKSAAEINWKRGRFARGGSTITQQLARNLYLSPSKNPLRKLKELIIALQLEWCLSKERILELYLNVVEWGNGVFGAEAAAQHYFGVSAAQLSASQAAFLAAILPRPRYYDLHRSGPYLQRRAAQIEARLGRK